MGGPISKENNWASMNAIYQFKWDMVNYWPKCEALGFNGTERPSWQEILEDKHKAPEQASLQGRARVMGLRYLAYGSGSTQITEGVHMIGEAFKSRRKVEDSGAEIRTSNEIS
jgi:hypothetical protein